MLCNLDDGTSVKSGLSCGGSGMLECCFDSEFDCILLRFDEDVKFDEDLWMLARKFDGQPLPKLGPLLVVSRRPISRLYFAERFNHLVRDCDFELRLRPQCAADIFCLA